MGIIDVIIYLVGNAFRICVTYNLMTSFFPDEVTIKRRYVRYFAFVVYFMVISVEFLFFCVPAGILLVSNVVGLFLLTLPYMGKIKYKILTSIGILSINLICENWAYNMLVAMHVKHILATGTVVSDLLFLILALIIQKIVQYRGGEDVSLLEAVLLLFIPAVSIIIAAIVIDDCIDESVITIGSISLLLMNVFAFYLISYILNLHREQYRLGMLEQQSEAYEKQLKLMLASNEEIRALKHDLKNHFMVLAEMSEAGNNEDIGNYISSLNTVITSKSGFSSTGNIIIDSLLNYKLGDIEQSMEFKPIADISIAQELPIENSDWSIILGNLLDNALEAVKSCNKDRYLKLSIKQNLSVVIISVENSYSGEIKYKNGRFISTKNDNKNHGIGLQNVERTVKKYSGEMKINYTNNFFKIKLMMYI